MTSIRKAKKLGIYIKPVSIGVDYGRGNSETSYWDGEKWVVLQGVKQIHEGQPIIPRLAKGGMASAVRGFIHAGEVMASIKDPFGDVWKKKRKGKRYIHYRYRKGLTTILKERLSREFMKGPSIEITVGGKKVN